MKITSQFDQIFPDELACLNHLADLKWGEYHKEFECPKCHCNRTHKNLTKTGLFRCQECDFRVSIRSGTIFEDSKLPLSVWFKAMWVMSNHEWGLNASDLKKILGLKNYPVAVGVLRKLRHAMALNNTQSLESMNLEVGRALISTLHEKSPILVIVEKKNPFKLCRIRLQKISPGYSRKFALEIVRHVRRGANVWAKRAIYNPFLGVCFDMRLVVTRENGKIFQAPSELHFVHKVTRSLKLWLSKKYKGHVQATHFQQYLDEFAFWWNSKIEVMTDPNVLSANISRQLFDKLLRLAVITEPMKLNSK